VLTLSDPGYELWRQFSDGRADVAQHPIVSRWKRVSELTTAYTLPPRIEEGLEERQQRSENRFAGSRDLLRATADEIARRGCAILFADEDGILVATHGVDQLADPNLRKRFPDGTRCAEPAGLNNAIGTALAENSAVTLVGRAHLDQGSHGLVCYAAPIHDVDGQVAGILDITGPVEAEDPLMGVTIEGLACALEGLLRGRALEQLADRVKALELQQAESRHNREDLAEALRATETLIATVGHDLRNPLNAVLSGAEALARGDDSQRQRVAERIRSSARRMLALIDQLSDVARARLAGGVQLSNPIPVDLVGVVDRVIDELRAVHLGRTILTEKTGDCRGLWDAPRIEQVVSNLIGNALRHGDHRQPILVVVDGSRTESVRLTVSNAGEIPASVLPHIFDPFRTANPRRTGSEGLGLGLYIVQQLVRAHSGEVDVVTKNGTTTFAVSLPRRPPV